MSDNNSMSYSTLSTTAKSITIKSFLAAVLCLIVYMSVLLIYRGIFDDALIGYTKTDIKNKQNEEVFYFSGDDVSELPESDEQYVFSPIYVRDGVSETVSQLVSFTILSLMNYDAAWNYGAHQRNALGINRDFREKFEGLKLGVLGSIVGIVAYGVMLISKFSYAFFGAKVSFAIPLFSFVNSAFLPYLNFFLGFNENSLYTHSPSGITALTQWDIFELSNLGIIMMIIPIILKILVCFIGYELGFRQISIKDKLLYKSKPKDI